MMSLFDDKQADNIDAFNTISRYLSDILIICINYFDNMVSQIYPAELQPNKANTKASFFGLAFDHFLMILFLPKFTINMTSFKLLISHF